MRDIKKFTSLMKFRIYDNENKKFNYYGFVDDNNFINIPKDVNRNDIEECILKSCWYDEKADKCIGTEIYIGDIVEILIPDDDSDNYFREYREVTEYGFRNILTGSYETYCLGSDSMFRPIANIHQKIKYNKTINMVKKNNYETFAILP